MVSLSILDELPCVVWSFFGACECGTRSVDLSHLQGEDFDLDGVRESLNDFLEVEWWQVDKDLALYKLKTV